MLKQETLHRIFESDKDPFVTSSGDERELLLLLAAQDARAAQARAREEATIDAEDISTQAEEALVMG